MNQNAEGKQYEDKNIKVPTFVEYTDPRFVALYDTLNPFAADTSFYLELAKKLSASSIIDLGCGTGLLTCELAKRGYRVVGGRAFSCNA